MEMTLYTRSIMPWKQTGPEKLDTAFLSYEVIFFPFQESGHGKPPLQSSGIFSYSGKIKPIYNLEKSIIYMVWLTTPRFNIPYLTSSCLSSILLSLNIIGRILQRTSTLTWVQRVTEAVLKSTEGEKIWGTAIKLYSKVLPDMTH